MMKQAKKTWLFFILIAIAPLATSCQKENGNNNDNTGIELRIRNTANGYGQLNLLRLTWQESDTLTYESALQLFISESNNFCLNCYLECTYNNINNVSILYDKPDAQIVCVGNVHSLSRINNIPDSGWSNKLAVRPGCGYIIKSSNPPSFESCHPWCRYARVYVEDWIEGTSGGIIGAIIRYQDDWKIVE